MKTGHLLILCFAGWAGAAQAALPKVTPASENRIIFQNYPVESLKRGEEGTVDVKVRAMRDGRILRCAVIASSGYAALDTATCDLMIANARIKPVTTVEGRRIEGNRLARVVWELPVEARRDPPPARSSLRRLASAREDVICRWSTLAGSLFIRKKVCLTQHDWDLAESYARAESVRLQTAFGPPMN